MAGRGHTAPTLPKSRAAQKAFITGGGADPQLRQRITPSSRPRAHVPPARGFQTLPAAQGSENNCSLPCLQLLPPLSPHLEYYANNNGVLLGKRDLIAAYTPREGKIGFSPDLISSLYLFFSPSLILSLSSKFLFSPFQLPASRK